jgi:hypothetical protein
MSQFSQTACQIATDLPKTFGLRRLTKQHGHKNEPSYQTLWLTMCLMSINQLVKLLTVNNGQKLTEQTGMAYHEATSFMPYKEDFLHSLLICLLKRCFEQK